MDLQAAQWGWPGGGDQANLQMGESEVQRGDVTGPRSHSWWAQSWGEAQLFCVGLHPSAVPPGSESTGSTPQRVPVFSYESAFSLTSLPPLFAVGFPSPWSRVCFYT